jgi:outer membrane lipoprotein SlyB
MNAPSRRNEDMSTNQRLTKHTTESRNNTQAVEKKSKKSQRDLSVTQLVGGALAAMTAAALGSQLSVAGTVIGAALASIIAAVAGSLYTASLRRTRDKVKTVFLTGQPNEVEDPTVMEILPDSEGHIAGQRSHLLAPETQSDPSPGPGSKLNWKRVAVAALAIFGIAAASLTAFELATGHALSGGKGTTIQQVSEGKSDKGSDTKKKAPSKKPSETPSEKATTAAPRDEPTAQPSKQAASPQPQETTSAPVPEASATAQPTTVPKATSSSSP